MYYIGVDLGGTTIKVGLVDENYQIIESISGPTKRERAQEEVLKDMAMLCKEVMAKRNLSEKDIHSIGIGSPGIASPTEGIILSSSNLNFNHVNVRSEIQKYIHLDVYVENDANCAALGEVMSGAAKGQKNVVVVTLGTGVGGGIILDGKIYRGSFCGAGEIGHLVIKFDGGQPCGCGRKGCWEQYASATALIREAKAIAKVHPETQILALAKDKEVDHINAKNVFDAAQRGDVFALEVLDTYYRNIACGVTNLINILEPNMIVLGGGMSAQKEYLTDPVTKYVKEEMYGGLQLKTQIKAATLGNDAGIIGAALLGTTL
ncbi:glucokinase [Sporanaerobium hydrogeniformans]|uniref:Glucokinase n=1 Tax=Sporanaerobium hydrogeniformans TaxID=3072179 RepID=A0AC61DG88_9FIRM|nr:ROK family glucokinase [Sporanaerobium hydrogeniformans]PHV72048.1 glucokinase [Sporanaerobium hydrogeniformans]